MSKRSRDDASGTAAAVDVLDDLRKIYNRPCHNQPVLDAKGGNSTAASGSATTAKKADRAPKPMPRVGDRVWRLGAGYGEDAGTLVELALERAP